MESVMAVNTQLSSPSGDRRSERVPGNVSIGIVSGTYSSAARHE